MKKIISTAAILLSVLAAPAFASGYMAASIVGAEVQFSQYTMVALMGQTVMIKANIWGGAVPFHMQNDRTGRQVAVVL